MGNYLFDVQVHLQVLKIMGEKDDFITRYETMVQPFNEIKGFSDFPFYEPYLARMMTIPYRIPEDLADKFDWEMLFRLMNGSLTNSIDFECNLDNALPEILIGVPSAGNDGQPARTVNRVSELWSYQVLRLFELYTEELMNHELLSREDPFEDNGLSEQNEIMLRKNRELVFQIKKTQLINGLML